MPEISPTETQGHPRIVGEALGQILSDREVAVALFEILEIQRIVEGTGRLVPMPRGAALLGEMLAARGQTPPGGRPSRRRRILQ
jgi:hypothetical protein